jgi:hypothetical protein
MDDEYGVTRRLPGEQATAELNLKEGEPSAVVLLSPVDSTPVPVSFIITNYRVHAAPDPSFGQAVSKVNLPLMMIEHHYNGQDQGFFTLILQTKLVYSFTFGFRDENVFKRILRTFATILQPTSLRNLPAFDIVKALRKSAKAAQAAALETNTNGSAAANGGHDSKPLLTEAPALGTPNEETAAGEENNEESADQSAVAIQPPKVSPSPEGIAAEPSVAKFASPGTFSTSTAIDHVSVLTEYAEWITDAGWALFDHVAELERELVPVPGAPPQENVEAAGVKKDLRPWFRVTTLNQPTNSYGTFATYPTGLVAPNSCSDDLLLRATTFRSRCRIPAISYVCLATGAVLARSSQPLLRQSEQARKDDSMLCNSLVNPYNQLSTKPRDAVPASLGATATAAVSTNKSAFTAPPSLVDEEWVVPEAKDVAAAVAAGPRFLNVVDLRPKTAATGNMAMGGGFESGLYYSMCRVTFAGIDNIHGVSSAWAKLRALVSAHNGRGAKPDFYEQLHNTQWLYHIQRVLASADNIAALMSRGESVLTHCTDGWDRTSQATSLAMIMLDPFFRTVRGFCLLIEKEFCSFGHKFAERNNHVAALETCGTAHISGGLSDVDRQQDQSPGHLKHQPSPIFSQWLDCVYQVVRQYPTRFEFTSNLLELVAFHLHSCFFGTFLCNCAKERILEGVTTQTISLWSEIERLTRIERAGGGPAAATLVHPMQHPSRRLLNPLYTPPPADFDQSKIDHLKMCVGSSRLVFWESFYLRYDADRWNGDLTVEDAAFARLSPPQQDPSRALWQQALQRASALHESHATAVSTRDANITRKDAGTGQAAHIAADPKAKQCWRCHERFGFLKAGQPCSVCQHLHCAKCLQSGSGKSKQCESCAAIAVDE